MLSSGRQEPSEVVLNSDDDRRARTLHRAREILAAPPPERNPPEIRAAAARVEAAVASPNAANWALHGVVDVSLASARALCEAAWMAPYERVSDGSPNIAGSCEGKALWLRDRLGGVVVAGWSTEDAGPEFHAVLLFVSGGKLFVADAGEVTPAEQYKFFFSGFYFPGSALP